MVYQVKDKDDFADQLKNAGQKLVVVDFFATWCGPCVMIAPKLQEMSEAMSDVVFLKVDVDENEDLSVKYNITCMPTFIFIKDGKQVGVISGANEGKIREHIAKYK